ncbi:hypothetical protein C2845_PM04G24410 [Panicum miliaceum]|uniref:RING-type domain-containing protein n=1 Tax=Panicum miliaceum TaxID=4540 RepID=A0A3L6QUE6_PANMI|nr:hypothetical protein C2845_PM04G24410 [Panicum miliaceum]
MIASHPGHGFMAYTGEVEEHVHASADPSDGQAAIQRDVTRAGPRKSVARRDAVDRTDRGAREAIRQPAAPSAVASCELVVVERSRRVSRLAWHTSSACLDIISSLFSGRIVWEKVSPALQRAVQSQMSLLSTPFIDNNDLFETGSTGGMSRDLIDRIPKMRFSAASNCDQETDSSCCSVCLQDFGAQQFVRALPQCQHRAETFNSCRTIDFQMAKFLREIIGAKASL